MFSFFASFIDKSYGGVEKSNFTRMNKFHTEMVSKLVLSHNGATLTAVKLASL